LEVILYGNTSDPQKLFEEIRPRVVVELYDKDIIGQDFLGRVTAEPTFLKEPNQGELKWYQSQRLREDSGEVLAAFEIFPFESAPDVLHPKKKWEPFTNLEVNVIEVPKGVRPEVETVRVEILTWGLRQLRNVFLLPPTKPSLRIECAGIEGDLMVMQRDKIAEDAYSPDRKSSWSFERVPLGADSKGHMPAKMITSKDSSSHIIETEIVEGDTKNFDLFTISFTATLPVKEIYAPSLNIMVYDNRPLGMKPLVGTLSLRSVSEYVAFFLSPKHIVFIYLHCNLTLAPSNH